MPHMEQHTLELVDLLDLTDCLVCITDAQGEVAHRNLALRELAPHGDLSHKGIQAVADRLFEVEHRPLSGGRTARIGRPAPSATANHGVLDALVRASPLAIVVLDLSMNVTMWNPAAEKMFDHPASSVIGQRYPLVPDDEWDRFEGLFSTVISGQGFTGVEAEREAADGRRIWIAISTAPIRATDGEVVGAMALLEDITERRELEERYNQAAKLEAIGRLAGGVAHDFNNMLTVILAYSDALYLDATDTLVAEGASAIRRAAERAAELTGQLLAFSRRQVLQTRDLDLNEELRRSLAMLSRLIGDDIEIETYFSEAPAWVRADPAQLERLVMNLAVNARDAMPTGGTLALKTTVLPDRSGAPSTVELRVSDTGHGMDEGTRQRIFEPFFTTKPPGKGTGLGLASVYGIVRQSGGEVTVESTPGEGTSFRVQLPTSGPAVAQAPAPTRPVPLDRAATILLAEDEASVRAMMRTMLESRGFMVLAAPNGPQALRLAAAHEGTIDLLLTDVVMPQMGGSELAEKLTAVRPNIRVLYASGYTDDEVVRRGADSGANFIQKPFTTSRLTLAVQRALQDEQPAEE